MTNFWKTKNSEGLYISPSALGQAGGHSEQAYAVQISMSGSSLAQFCDNNNKNLSDYLRILIDSVESEAEAVKVDDAVFLTRIRPFLFNHRILSFLAQSV